jgi:hypothetical protein
VSVADRLGAQSMISGPPSASIRARVAFISASRSAGAADHVRRARPHLRTHRVRQAKGRQRSKRDRKKSLQFIPSQNSLTF